MILQKVIRLLSDELGVDEANIGSSMSLEDLGVDEMAMDNLVMALESEYGLEVSPEQTDRFETVEDVAIFVEVNLEEESTNVPAWGYLCLSE